MANQGLSRVAVVQCLALSGKGRNSCNFEEVASVSVKVHEKSGFESLTETVTLQTQRHAALWHDSANWISEGKDWKRNKDVDILFHLREVFAIAKQYCKSGVRANMRLQSIIY